MTSSRGGDEGRARGVPEAISAALFAIGMTVVALFSGILLVLALGSTAFYAEPNYEDFVISSVIGGEWGPAAASLVACLVLLAAAVALARRVVRWSEPAAVVAALALTTALGLWWVLIQGAQSSAFPDSQHVLTYAMEAARGDWSSFTDSAGVTALELMPDDAHRYFTQYPFQSGVFLVFMLVCRLFPADPVAALLVINVIANEVSFACLYALGRWLVRSAGGRAAMLLLMVLCVPLWISAALPYGNSLGLAFGCIFLLLQGRALVLPREARVARVALVVVSIVPLCAVMVVKSTFILLGVAALIAWVVRGLRQRTALLPALVLVAVAVANAAGGVPARLVEDRTGLDLGDGMPKASWIVMGLNESDVTGLPGWWDLEAWEIMMDAEGDIDAQGAEALARITERLGELAADPAEALAFFSAKLSTEWCEPTFESVYYSSLSVRSDGTFFDPYAALGLEFPAREALVPWDGYQSLAYLGALLGFARLLKRHDDEGVGTLLAAVFLAGFGCYLLWEAKSVYTLPFFFMLLPVAAYGLEGLASIAAPRTAGGAHFAAGPRVRPSLRKKGRSEVAMCGSPDYSDGVA